jgi:hypothetical protein
VWILRLCNNIGIKKSILEIECDSQSVIAMAKNPTYNSESKNIDVKYHFVREMEKVCVVN